MSNTKLIIYLIISIGSLNACNQYLDIVPDNVATIEYAFRMRSTAERFLFTCYSYMPDHGDSGVGTSASVLNGSGNPAWYAGDEYWFPANSSDPGVQIARGNQNVSTTYMNFWQGTQGGKDLYEGIHQCNLFLENIDLVPDIVESEKRRWIAEVKFLKAYYHYWLTRMYGPIVIIKENLPVSAGTDEVKLQRSPVDSCFSYIYKLLNESEIDLPDKVDDELSELGRITKAIELSVKAQVLITAASPLFNGNPDYQGFSNQDGTPLFNTTYDPAKWDSAAVACKEAIDFCKSLGHQLYYYTPHLSQYDLSDTTLTQMSIRNAVCEKWNPEIIWGNTNSMATGKDVQRIAIPRGLDPVLLANTNPSGTIAPPLKIAGMFYSNHGVPITEDKTWDYSGRFNLKVPGTDHRYYLKSGYTTAQFNFNREPRFYADLGFDGGIWYGQGRYDDQSSDLLYVSSKFGQPAAATSLSAYSTTGYWPKKLIHFENVIGTGTTYTTEDYPWPVIRLADLYLLYAEALNEVHGPVPEVFEYINQVRDRAGIPAVEESWTNFSKNPGKHTTQNGLREIIHTERLIELAFEGKRFWDLRRWKEAANELNKPITGWNLEQETAEGYYRERIIFNQSFTTRDYLWPLNETAVFMNNKLVQNPGW